MNRYVRDPQKYIEEFEAKFGPTVQIQRQLLELHVKGTNAAYEAGYAMGRSSAEMQQTAVQSFQNPSFGRIRTIEQDGKVLFCGRDVAAALGYANTKDALSKHCKGSRFATPFRLREEFRKFASSRKAMFIGSLPTAACLLPNSSNAGCSTKCCRKSEKPVVMAGKMRWRMSF